MAFLSLTLKATAGPHDQLSLHIELLKDKVAKGGRGITSLQGKGG